MEIHLRIKAEKLIELLDKSAELQSELTEMEKNTEFPFTYSELEEQREKIKMLNLSIFSLTRIIGNHFEA